jgi:ATP-dependent Clp protease ATP-binding subunit ClpC
VLTDPASASALEAIDEARRLHHAHLGVEHLFVGLTRHAGGSGDRLLRSLGLDPVHVRDAIRAEAGSGKGSGSGDLPLTPRLAAVLEEARASSGNASPSGTDLLRAIFAEGGSLPVRYLASLGHAPAQIRARLASNADPEAAEATRLRAADTDIDSTRLSPEAPAMPQRPSAPAPSMQPGPAIMPRTAVPTTLPTPTLDRFGRDLSKLARLGRLAEAIGRDDEIEQTITILARTQKSNPLLLGEAGVGKSAIIEGIAWRIATGSVPATLRGKRIVELDMGSLTAGTSLRGQFEERMGQIVQEASDAPEVILFIDEVHTVVGAGAGSGGGNDAAQMLKPALARGDISCIGATTQDEYARYIRKDPALERRFSPVTIKEMTAAVTRAVLEKVAVRIVEKQKAQGHQISITVGALAAAVALTDRYVKDRHQPDKSIDAIDLACAKAVVTGRQVVTGEDVAATVSEWTGIPASRLTADEQTRYSQMEEVLRRRVVGQDEAVSIVSRSVRAALAGVKTGGRPIGVFLFMGPSGVGKTKLAKELAAFLFDTPDALIRVDMSEYQEKHSLSNLIGAPRGYQDSERGGQLSESLRRRPYSVVLLDEIEKAHPDIFNLFLSVFDDGRLTSSLGQVIDCSNAVFILTSNLGSDLERRTIGFERGQTVDLRRKAAEFLRPELVNRITEVVSFAPLGRTELGLILDQVVVEKTRAFCEAQGVTIEVDASAKELILDGSFDAAMGARPLERAVELRLVQPLVDAIFAGRIARGTVRVIAEGNEICLVPEKGGSR